MRVHIIVCMPFTQRIKQKPKNTKYSRIFAIVEALSDPLSAKFGGMLLECISTQVATHGSKHEISKTKERVKNVIREFRSMRDCR